MATSDKPEESVQTIPIPLIWLDANAYDDQGKQMQRKLNKNFGRCKFLEERTECQNTLTKPSIHEHYVLIVSGQIGRDYVPTLENNNKISAIYIYCQNVEGHKTWSKDYKKVRHVTNNCDDLISHIRADHASSSSSS